MALNEIWTVVHAVNSFTPLWADPRRLDSPLATVGQPRDFDGILTEPESTITLRTRYRPDIRVGAALVGPDERIWYVNELLEVGRHKYLDLGLSTYLQETSTIQPPDPADPLNAVESRKWPASFTPPENWPFLAGGEPLEELVIQTVTEHDLYRRQGLFVPIADLTGEAAGEWYTEQHVSQVLRTGNICEWLLASADLGEHLGTNYIDLITYQATEVETGRDSEPDDLLTNIEQPLGAGDVLRMLSADEVATWTGT